MRNYVQGEWRNRLRPRASRCSTRRPAKSSAARLSRPPPKSTRLPGGPAGLPRLAPRARHRTHPVPVQAEAAARGAASRTWPAPSRWSAARRSASRAARCAGRSRTSRSPAARPSSSRATTPRTSPSGIDEMMVRQPLGVCAIIAPFNFPGMIPFWFLPYAIACGNTVLVKPSERVPMTMQKVFELLDRLELPPGVVNLVNGGREAVDAILDHPTIRAVELRRIEHRGAARLLARRGRQARPVPGGRQEPGGDPAGRRPGVASEIVADSAFGCAGQRCLASSVAIAVGEAAAPFTDAMRDRATGRRDRLRPRRRRADGAGDHAGEPQPDRGAHRAGRQGRRAARSSMARCPDIPNYGPRQLRAPDRARGPAACERHHAHGDLRPGAVDPRGGRHRRGDAVRQLRGVRQPGVPVHDQRRRARGSSATRRRSATSASTSGVAAPMAFFPFSGARESFFGDLHGQGRDAIEFFTQEKVVVERWPKDWSRRF